MGTLPINAAVTMVTVFWYILRQLLHTYYNGLG